MLVVKRNGTKVEYDRDKVIKAIEKAFLEVDGEITSDAKKTAANISYDIEHYELVEGFTVEDIQDTIEEELMSCDRKDVARSFVRYRYKRELAREATNKYKEMVKRRVDVTVVENSNANVDESSFSGREKEAASDIFKLVNQEELPEFMTKAHEEMIVYQHDYEKALFGVHNCANIDFNHVLENGFTTRNGGVRAPSTFSTACQLVAVIFQCQSQVQFGGVGSIHLDYDLAPYVKKSFIKKYEKGLRYFEELDESKIKTLIKNTEDINIESDYFKYFNSAYSYAMKELEEEGLQAAQGLFHNLGTLESRQGSQVPFTSINYGRDTSPEGRLVSKWMMQASLDGIGKHHSTPIFPISIFQYKQGTNANPGDANYDLKKMALTSMSKRIYPNFCNGDWSQAHEDLDNPDTYMSTMGCRTLVSYDRNGMGYIRQGRGNIVPNTIILPKLGVEYGICLGNREVADIDGFWKALDKTLKTTEDSLLVRYSIISKQSPKAAPFMYSNGTMAGTLDCKEDVSEMTKHGSLAIGILGMAEMCQAMFGMNHAQDSKVHDFALSVVRRIYDYAQDASERNGLNFGLYYSPAEGLCRKALVELRKQYGVIENVTSNEFLTNSIHVPVWEKVSIYDKLRIESPFTKYATAGCITYVELESTFMNNIEAIESIIDYAFKELDIPYLAFNFPIDNCLDCGYQGEFNVTCDECGSKNIQQLRRVTGYLTTDYKNFNEGKQKETEMRVKHSAYTNFGEANEN